MTDLVLKTRFNLLLIVACIENATKCFERFLELAVLSYFGPPSSTGPIIRRNDTQNGILAGELLNGESEIAQSNGLSPCNLDNQAQ
jgi:hypothetical protein